jgi:hypothetical protein
MGAPSLMADAANVFLNSLTPEQRAQATYAFQDDQRLDWHFVPKPRKGLPLKEMAPHQKILAHALLSAGLSQRGYLKATTIMTLEEVLRVLEDDDGVYRNPEGYFVTVFGEPSEETTWGYRFEGHHVSQNFTIVDGKVAGSPSFFGANPARVLDGPRKGLRALAREEDLARALIQGLSPGHRRTAIVDTEAYPEILTTASRKAALTGQPSGLRVSEMTADERKLLQDLLAEYCQNMPAQLALAREEQIKNSGDDIYFAWAGGTEKGEGHYYRIQSPLFLVEYDHTQNDNNHVHSVWRDFEGDFGLDLLKQHYETSHR